MFYLEKMKWTGHVLKEYDLFDPLGKTVMYMGH